MSTKFQVALHKESDLLSEHRELTYNNLTSLKKWWPRQVTAFFYKKNDLNMIANSLTTKDLQIQQLSLYDHLGYPDYSNIYKE